MSRIVSAALAVLALGGCLSARVRGPHDALAVRAREPGRPRAAEAARAEALLEQQARLDLILALALARNRDLEEARLRLQAALGRVRTSARLPDPELLAEVSGAPLARPWAWDESQMIRLGLRQSFPAPGSLEARSRVALHDAEAAEARREQRRQDLVAQARRAYLEYYQAERTLRIVEEQRALTAQMVELSRASYLAGRATTADILRLEVEQGRLDREHVRLEQAKGSARLWLNALMDRPLQATLGPPAEIGSRSAAEASQLERAVEARLPELAEARAAVGRSQATLDGARSAARWPSLMLGADYTLMPMMEEPHGYALMLGLSLPWLGARAREQVAEAERGVAAEQQALSARTLAARQQLAEAALRERSARARARIVEERLLVRARQSLDAARASYASGQGDGLGLVDALRAYLDVRLEDLRARVDVALAAAELDRAAGLPAPDGGAAGGAAGGARDRGAGER